MPAAAEGLSLGATAIARGVAAGELVVSEVVGAHIDRIERVNPRINAVITPMFDRARAEAKLADERIAAEGTADLPPLFGVPVTVKDCWAVEGERFTAGSWFRREFIADHDAEVVGRLRRAGAIILGKTNLPDMCWGFESVNPVFGRTHNPRALDCSAGGSSGGEGAIIAAGGSALGVGSDIGGSVRNPAAVNGIVSFKPTPGRIPAEDHVPLVAESIRDWNVAGPLARRVEDLALAFSVLADVPPVEMPAIGGVRCVLNLRSGLNRPRREVRDTLIVAAQALDAAGMDVNRNDSLPLDRLGIAYTSLLRREAMTRIREELGGGEEFSWLREFWRGVRGDPHIAREALMVEAYIRLGGRLGGLIGEGSFAKVERHGDAVGKAIGDGVLLCPLLLTRPPKHGATWFPLTQIPFATPFNAMGMPAAIVPVRWTENGLPLAVQVAARAGADELVLAVAGELEDAFGGWRMADA